MHIYNNYKFNMKKKTQTCLENKIKSWRNNLKMKLYDMMNKSF